MINASNMVTISGGLTRDPEYREDIGLVTFSIGVDNAGREGGQTASGFFDIDVWTKDTKFSPAFLGEYVVKALGEKTLAKGSRVNIIGRLKQDRFETKDGSKASRVTITAENMLVVWSHVGVENKKANGGGNSYSNNDNSNASTASASVTDANDSDDSDGGGDDWVPANF